MVLAEVGGAELAAMHVMGVSEMVMLARIWGGAEEGRLTSVTCPPSSSLQHTHRQGEGAWPGDELREVEEGEEPPTANPSAMQVS